MRALALALTLAGFAGLHATAALGREPSKPMSAEDRREAKRLFNQAHLAYRQGEYEEAILKWEQSYELSGEPLIFEAISNAYERLGDAKKAYEALAKWREHAPADEHEELDRRLDNLQRRIDADAEKARIEAEQLRQARQAAQAEQRDHPRPPTPPHGEPQPDTTSADEALERNRIIAWSVTGLGAAAVVTGVVLDAVAAGTRPDVDEACAGSDDALVCRSSQSDDIGSSNTLAIAGDITWIAGSAITVTGLVLLFTVASGDTGAAEPAATARIVPWAGPGLAGGSLRLAF